MTIGSKEDVLKHKTVVAARSGVSLATDPVCGNVRPLTKEIRR